MISKGMLRLFQFRHVRIHAAPCKRHYTNTCNILTGSPSSDMPYMRYALGPMANLAEGSATCVHGDTAVFAVVSSKRVYDPRDSFLPLTVDYRSRQYAYGKIPANVQRRERHGTDEEILVARIIDRAIRPLFPKGYVDEVQVTVTPHGIDKTVDPVVPAVNAASCALLVSNQPWNGPIGCVRVGIVDGTLKENPTTQEMESSPLDLLYAGTEHRSLMIETIAKEVDDTTMQQAIAFAHSRIQYAIEQQKLTIFEHTGRKLDTQPVLIDAATVASAAEGDSSYGLLANNTSDMAPDVHIWKRESIARPVFKPSPEMLSYADSVGYANAMAVFALSSIPRSEQAKMEGRTRYEILHGLKDHEVYGKYNEVTRAMAADEIMTKAFRDTTLLRNTRVDGRPVDTIRPIHSYVDVLPSVHGSSFFQRGDTHVLGTVTLGDRRDVRLVEAIDGSGEKPKHFYLHYDFPPYCTGEVGNATAVNRRMIGHGRLAEKAIQAVMPTQQDFPYTVRVFAECTSSSGSSSMASACAASLSLMDAGVPISAPVAGVSIGIMANPINTAATKSISPSRSRKSREELKQEEYTLLTDIMGMEDHYGDMDFKIAGTRKGITAMQLDVKLADGIPVQAIKEALLKAHTARLSILDAMDISISSPRPTIKPHAPLAVEIRYDPDRKRHLIGPGGEMIRFIENTYQCEINTEEDGVAHVFGYNRPGVREAEQLILDLLIEPQEGDIHMAEVLDVKDYGATVRLTRTREALLHISELTHNGALSKRPVHELLAPGQRVQVQVIGVDRGAGTVKVSRKVLLDGSNATGDNLAAQTPTKAEVEAQLTVAPTFPVIPPRSFSPDYFLHSVASQEDIDKASGRVPTSEEIESSTNVGLSHRKRQNESNKRTRGITFDGSVSSVGNGNRNAHENKDAKIVRPTVTHTIEQKNTSDKVEGVLRPLSMATASPELTPAPAKGMDNWLSTSNESQTSFHSNETEVVLNGQTYASIKALQLEPRSTLIWELKKRQIDIEKGAPPSQLARALWRALLEDNKVMVQMQPSGPCATETEPVTEATALEMSQLSPVVKTEGVVLNGQMYHTPAELHGLGVGRILWELGIRNADVTRSPVEILSLRLWNVLEQERAGVNPFSRPEPPAHEAQVEDRVSPSAIIHNTIGVNDRHDKTMDISTQQETNPTKSGDVVKKRSSRPKHRVLEWVSSMLHVDEVQAASINDESTQTGDDDGGNGSSSSSSSASDIDEDIMVMMRNILDKQDSDNNTSTPVAAGGSFGTDDDGGYKVTQYVDDVAVFTEKYTTTVSNGSMDTATIGKEESEDPVDSAPVVAPVEKKKRSYRRKQPTSTVGDGSDANGTSGQVDAPVKRRRKGKTTTTATEPEDAVGKPKRTRKKNTVSPSSPEITPSPETNKAVTSPTLTVKEDDINEDDPWGIFS